MAKKTCNLNLDEQTILALDDAARVLGMSRSQVANQVLGATLGKANMTEVVSTMFASAISARKDRERDAAGLLPA